MKTMRAGDISILELAGRFDAYGAPQIEKYLKQLCAEAGNSKQVGSSPRVIIDLSEVNFIDSLGLATLVQGMKRCRERNGDIYLCSIQPSVRIIMELTRLDRVFSIFATREEALGRLAHQSQASSTYYPQ